MAESSSSSLVPDGGNDGNDVAMRINGEKMRIEVDDRQTFQRCFLWTPSKTVGKKGQPKSTAESYEPEKQGPTAMAAKGIKFNKKPGKEELTPVDGGHTQEYMEVGMIFGDDPRKYMPTKEQSGQKQKHTFGVEQSKRGVLPRDATMMRVFMLTTEAVPSSAKCFVGVQPSNGRLFPRVGTVDTVFYYPELWDEARKLMPSSEKKDPSAKERGRAIQQACRLACARDKEAHRRTAAPITTDEVSKALAQHPWAVTQKEHVASMLNLQFSMYEHTGEKRFIDAMKAFLDGLHPDLKYGTSTSTEGTNYFMDFKSAIPEANAVQFSEELMNASDSIVPDVGLIRQIHAILREVPGNTSAAPKGKKAGKRVQPQERKLGDGLPITGLCFFMELCHVTCREHALQSDGTFDEEVVRAEVAQALTATKVHMRHINIGRTASKSVVAEDDEDEDEEGNIRGLLQCLRDVMQKLVEYSDRSTAAIAAEHGGLLKHKSVKDLMERVGSAVDRATLQGLFEQLSVLHTGLHAEKGREMANVLRSIIEYLDAALDACSKRAGGK